jgi:hypothetical protein
MHFTWGGATLRWCASTFNALLDFTVEFPRKTAEEMRIQGYFLDQLYILSCRQGTEHAPL